MPPVARELFFSPYAPIRTLLVLMISFINNQPAIQFGAVLSVILWVPSLMALLFAYRIIGSGSFARGFGG